MRSGGEGEARGGAAARSALRALAARGRRPGPRAAAGSGTPPCCWVACGAARAGGAHAARARERGSWKERAGRSAERAGGPGALLEMEGWEKKRMWGAPAGRRSRCSARKCLSRARAFLALLALPSSDRFPLPRLAHAACTLPVPLARPPSTHAHTRPLEQQQRRRGSKGANSLALRRPAAAARGMAYAISTLPKAASEGIKQHHGSWSPCVPRARRWRRPRALVSCSLSALPLFALQRAAPALPSLHNPPQIR